MLYSIYVRRLVYVNMKVEHRKMLIVCIFASQTHETKERDCFWTELDCFWTELDKCTEFFKFFVFFECFVFHLPSSSLYFHMMLLVSQLALVWEAARNHKTAAFSVFSESGF